MDFIASLVQVRNNPAVAIVISVLTLRSSAHFSCHSKVQRSSWYVHFSCQRIASLTGFTENQQGQQNAGGDANHASNLPAGSVATSRSGSSIGSSASLPSLSSSTTASSVSVNFPGNSAVMQGMSVEALTQFLAKASLGGKDGLNRSMSSITASLVHDQQKLDESWKHQAQARAILGNLIGPNGEQLTSTDPYNTTVSRCHIYSKLCC